MIQLMVQTIRSPLETWAQIRQLRLTTNDAWMLVIATAALAAILSWVGTLYLQSSAEAAGPLAALAQAPMAMAGVQLGSATLGAYLLTEVGKISGGKGRFTEALLAIGWVEAIMVVMQAIQLVLSIAMPPIGGLFGIATLLVAAYLVVAMTMAVHGFRNPLLVVFGIIATVMLTSLLLTMLASTLGLMPGAPQ